MAQKIKDVLGRRLGEFRRELWKLGTAPYNAAILLVTAAIMIQSQAWKIREP
ncbi:MAG: hypothetical protein HY897_13695 [Deltaproteobacteria bacterium]|nr:hypothetical protein [Deltaproteobacteria bacterium]